jgi:hypothetical protein
MPTQPDPHDTPTPMPEASDERTVLHDRAHQDLPAVHGLMPVPWRYARGQRVQYREYPDTPYRVIGRTVTEMEGMTDVTQYYVHPWTLIKVWMVDRPLCVYEIDLQPWPEEETQYVEPTQ